MSVRGTKASPGARAEDDRKQDEEEVPPGKEPDGKCSHCGMQNEDDAKFCDQCGKSMAAAKMKSEDDDPPSSKEPPSSSKPGEKKEAAHPPPPEKMSASASLALIVGAEADSPLVIKTAAIQMRQERDWLRATVAGITGRDGSVREMIGAALNIPGKLAAGKKAATDLAARQAKADDAERTDLVRRLNLTDTVKRNKLYADTVSDGGTRTGTRIRTRYATMDLDVLRGLVTDLEGDAPKKKRDPFEPDKDAAEKAALAAKPDAATFTDVQRKTLERHPTIMQMQSRGSALAADKLVAGLIATDPRSARAWLAQNGAAS